MATVTGLTAERMLQIEAASVVDAELEPDGDLVFTTHGGEEIHAGNILVTMGQLRDMLYPVGVIYMSVNETNPGDIFGGTWAAWGTGRVPVGIDAADTDFNAVEKTGGAKTHTLTSAQSGLPSHNHTQNSHNHTQNAHSHTHNAHNHTQDAHNHAINDPWHSHGQVVSANPGSGGTGVRMDYQADASGASAYPQGVNTQSAGTGIWNSAATATNQAATTTEQAATAVNQATTATNIANNAADASQPHNIQQKFITCYMWKRTA